jgi:hypothetical protein
MVNDEYELETKINRDALDIEFLNFPNKVYRATKLYADALDLKNKDKENLDLVYSELWLLAKSGVVEEQLSSKPTEETIKSWIKTQTKYQEAINQHLKSSHNADVLKGLVSSMDAMKGALSNLVSLLLANYFSTPKTEKTFKHQLETTAFEQDLATLEGSIPRRKKNV